MGRLISQCPSCGSKKVKIAKIECVSCGTKFEGSFDIPALLRLPEEDLDLVLDFIRCSGSLKELAEKQGISYPTMRNRLNALIEAIESLDSGGRDARDEILELLEKGKITAAEAAKRLKKL